MRRISIVNNDLKFNVILKHFLKTLSGIHTANIKPFSEQLKLFLNTKHCYLTSSGMASFSVILNTLKNLTPEKNEVILPAYAPSGLLLPIKAAGLKAVLCDVKHHGYIIDPSLLRSVVGNKTLAVISVNSFGIPVDIVAIEEAAKESFVIEDCAQSFGSESNSIKTGSVSKISFGSFARGKNFSLYHGGFLCLNSDEHLEVFEEALKNLPVLPVSQNILSTFKLILFSLLVQPFNYFFLSYFVSLIKSKKERASFSTFTFSQFANTLASSLFPEWITNYEKRIRNGLYLHHGLKDFHDIILPEIPSNSKIVFCRFPVMIKDLTIKQMLLEKLKKRCIESSFMYGKPLHWISDEGYALDDFPNACFLAEHLLTLPVHGNMKKKDLDIIINTFRETFK